MASSTLLKQSPETNIEHWAVCINSLKAGTLLLELPTIPGPQYLLLIKCLSTTYFTAGKRIKSGSAGHLKAKSLGFTPPKTTTTTKTSYGCAPKFPVVIFLYEKIIKGKSAFLIADSHSFQE